MNVRERGRIATIRLPKNKMLRRAKKLAGAEDEEVRSFVPEC